MNEPEPTPEPVSPPQDLRPSSRARLRLRAARPADAVACAAVMRAAIRALPPGSITSSQRRAWGSLPPLYHRWAMGPGEERYLVAERAGRAVGYAALRGPELTAVFVRPREQRRGTGRALVQAAAARARATGARTLTVVAARPAVAFYARLGFRGRRPIRVPLPGGTSLPGVRMALRLR